MSRSQSHLWNRENCNIVIVIISICASFGVTEQIICLSHIQLPSVWARAEIPTKNCSQASATVFVSLERSACNALSYKVSYTRRDIFYVCVLLGGGARYFIAPGINTTYIYTGKRWRESERVYNISGLVIYYVGNVCVRAHDHTN